MKLQNIQETRKLARRTEEPDPENDPYAAREALHREIEELANKVDFFFGSAGDVANTAARRRMAGAINSLRPLVKEFGDQLEAAGKKADKKVYNALKRFM